MPYPPLRHRRGRKWVIKAIRFLYCHTLYYRLMMHGNSNTKNRYTYSYKMYHKWVLKWDNFLALLPLLLCWLRRRSYFVNTTSHETHTRVRNQTAAVYILRVLVLLTCTFCLKAGIHERSSGCRACANGMLHDTLKFLHLVHLARPI